MQTLTLTIVAAEPLRKGRAVTFRNRSAKAGVKVFGICLEDTSAHEVAVLAVGGIASMMAGSRVEVGDTIESGHDGRAVRASGHCSWPLGDALENAEEGEIVKVLLRR